MFEWIDSNTQSMTLTIYPTNITLNAQAASYFENVRWVMMGIDEDSLQIAIKPISKDEIDLNLVAKRQLHKLSLGKGYARISSKVFVQRMEQMIQKDMNGVKVEAFFDEEHQMMIADLSSITQ